MVGIRIAGEHGALHPAKIVEEEGMAFMLLGSTEAGNIDAEKGQTLILSVEKVKRIIKNGKISYDAGTISAKGIEPPSMGNSIGDLDNLVSQTVTIDSPFDLDDT